jgi:hypothetical protein
MPEERCPMCLKMQPFDLENQEYYKFQNTERLVCAKCAYEVETRLRPSWQIIGKRFFPKSLLE